MRLDLDTEIRYETGELAGVLRKVVMDENGEVNEVVMHTDELVSRRVLVPMAMLAEGEGGVTYFTGTPDDLDGLPDYEEERVPAITDEWEPSEDPAPGAEVFPATMYQPIIPVAEEANLPEGSFTISQGTEVWCLDGSDRWGIVDEVIVGEDSLAQAFVGRPDDTEALDLLIPIGIVREAGPQLVMLNCTAADLPVYAQPLSGELEEPDVE